MSTDSRQAIQDGLTTKIPVDWRLSKDILESSQKDVSKIPQSCGLLSQKELEITSHDGTYILEKVHSSTWSAEEVCLAFCKRSAIVQQLVKTPILSE